MTRIWNALKSEDGAVTMDWIVLTGAAAFMAVATLTGLVRWAEQHCQDDHRKP